MHVQQELVARRMDEVWERLAALAALGPKLPRADAARLAEGVARLRTALAAGEIAEKELRRQQLNALEAMRRLAARVALELQNPLVVMATSTEILTHELPPDNPLHVLGQGIAEAVGQAAVLIEQLQTFASRQICSLRLLDLNEAVAEIVCPIKKVLDEDVELVTLPGECVGRIHADPVQIEQVLLNLVANALTAMLEGGTLTIRTAAVDRQPAEGESGTRDYVLLSVSDTGCGMTPDARSRALEPFFTTKEPQKGAGLGLSAAYGIVKQFGGDIEIESEPGRGTTVNVFLPRVPETAPVTSSEDTALSLLPSSDTIFLSPKDVPRPPKAAVPRTQTSETAR